MNRDTVLLVENLNIEYPGEETKIRDITFCIKRGEVFGLAGESGSGKSSVCKAVLGLLENRVQLCTGSVLLCGNELVRMPPQKHQAINGKDIGYVMQNPMAAFDPCMKIGTHFVMTIRAHFPCSKRDAQFMATDLLKRVGLADTPRVMNSYPATLSGGMLQRVMIAIAVALNPILMIADEPTTALDVQSQNTVLELLLHVARDFRPAMLLVSHDMKVMSRLADNIAVMYQGKIVEEGPTIQMLNAPRHEYTRRLIEAAGFDWEEGRC